MQQDLKLILSLVCFIKVVTFYKIKNSEKIEYRFQNI